MTFRIFIKKYKQTLNALLWAFVGIAVSISVIRSDSLFIFGWPLLVLSVLMIPLALKYYLQEKG